MTETPSLSTATSFGKYSIPSLYASFETTEVSEIKVTVVYGFDALKKPEEVK